MKLLIDTHALLWIMGNHPRLSNAARTAITDLSNDCYLSVVSVWEAATKHRSGKLPEAAPLVANPARILAGLRLTPLPLELEHAHLAGSMTAAHKDPFDRMLAAQCRLENLSLVTVDPAFREFGIDIIW